MSFAADDLTYARAVVTNPGTSVALSSQPPDNCHTVLITNPSSTVTVLVGKVTPPEALVPGVNAQRVPPGFTLTLAWGAVPSRNPITNYAADAIGGAVTPEFTFISQLG
jgi:hypothetical protein